MGLGGHGGGNRGRGRDGGLPTEDYQDAVERPVQRPRPRYRRRGDERRSDYSPTKDWNGEAPDDDVHVGATRGSDQRPGRGRSWRGGGSRRRGDGAVGNDDFNGHKKGAEHPGSHGKHRGGSHDRPRNPGGTKYMTREDIDELAESKPEDVIRFITENEGGFLAAYSHQPNCRHPLILKRLIKFLYLLVKSDDNHLAARIVAEIFNDNVGKGTVFCISLDTLIKKMPSEQRRHIKSENLVSLGYLIEIGTFAISAVPQSVMYTFPHLSINNTVQRLPLVGGDSVLVPKAQALTEEYNMAETELIHRQSSARIKVDGIDVSAPPPQHITELSVLPTTDEIHPHAAKPYLRPNITKGGYTDWEHYLDVQFRLMREDFVTPLRDGITTFELKGAKNLSDIRIYEGVSVCNTVCLHSGIGFQIQFDATKFRRVNWEHSKRLIFGSLLCFSRDNFQTIYFATVVKRDPKLLTNGFVTVQFEGDGVEDIFQIDPNEIFVMVESTAYFEAYRHILEGIKRASELHLTDRLQIFKKYLVDCQVNTRAVPVPRYLHISEHKCFRLKDVIGIKTGRRDVIVTDKRSWPPHEHTSLDILSYVLSEQHSHRRCLSSRDPLELARHSLV